MDRRSGSERSRYVEQCRRQIVGQSTNEEAVIDNHLAWRWNAVALIQHSITDAPREALGTARPPAEQGIYVLWYHGPFECYLDLGATPLYVGSGDLADRVRRARQKIETVENLCVADFTVAVLPAPRSVALFGEVELIDLWAPLWNTVIPGFGSNLTGCRRTGQRQSAWAVLHPGYSTTTGPRDEGPAELMRIARERSGRPRPRRRSRSSGRPSDCDRQKPQP